MFVVTEKNQAIGTINSKSINSGSTFKFFESAFLPLGTWIVEFGIGAFLSV
jgi:hypothetical protein